MCTAFSRNGHFGRTMDYEKSFGEELLFLPRRCPLKFRYTGVPKEHAAILGVGVFDGEFPLMFDGVNEFGVFAAALNFPVSAKYYTQKCGVYNLCSFEVLPWILANANSADEAAVLLRGCCVLDEPYSAKMPPSPLHWFVADSQKCFVFEATEGGARVFENAFGVLTNEPPFPSQIATLSLFCGLSACAVQRKANESEKGKTPCFTLGERLGLSPSSRGTGSIGLPGDFSSPSRLVRAAFALHNTECEAADEKAVAAFFRMASIASIPRGCVVTEGGELAYTRYTSCATKDSYCITTYYDHTPKGKSFATLPLDANVILSFDFADL